MGGATTQGSRCAVAVGTQQSGNKNTSWGKSGQEHITRELIYRAVTSSPPRILSKNSGGRRQKELCPLTLPSLLEITMLGSPGPPKEYKNIVSWEKEYCIS
jgi:hypothetical protein